MTSARPRLLLISDFNVQTLADLISGVDLAPFGQVTPALLQIADGTKAALDDAVMVWTRPEGVIGGYDALLKGETVAWDGIRAELEEFTAAVIHAARRVKHLFFVTWAEPPFRRNLGIAGMRPGGASLTLMKMNAAICERLAAQANIFVLNSAPWLSAAGQKAWSPKLWHLAKMPFSAEVFAAAAKDIDAAFRAIQGRTRKLLVLDLDDTLWGGIVGEVGWEGIRLGGHDAIGEAFLDFQRALKTLTQAGVVLAIASKNDEAAALEAILIHPEMILRPQDFAAWRINWSDKAQNIVEIANELNLDLSSVVYIDDSPAERSRIRSALPMVAVPDWPQDVFLYASSLMELTYFDKAAITAEDRQRSTMYAVDRERSQARQHFQSMDEWLASLQMEVTVEAVSKANIARAAQLFNKTNQMNLATRRSSEAELLQWSEATGNHVRVFRVADRFGDYGLTGIVGLEINGARAVIRDYLLSCRVMGRGVEQLMLGMAVDYARGRGAAEICAEYIPTAKNAPCLAFFKDHSRFERTAEFQFTWRVADNYPLPSHIVVKP